MSTLERANWTIEFSWVKVHVGIYGNELADRLAKGAVRNRDTTIAFNRIPTSALYSETEEEEEAKDKWQKEWKDCTKAAITKEFFPNVKDRLKLQIDINPIFTALVTGHGKRGLTSIDLRFWKRQHVLAKRETKRQPTRPISAHYCNRKQNFSAVTSCNPETGHQANMS